jgi:fatty acid CoA ligase FadD9
MTTDVSTQGPTLDGSGGGPGRAAHRATDLFANDVQIRDAAPRPEVMEAARVPSLRLPEVLATLVEGYGDRPALGSRARTVVRDIANGRTSSKLLPGFGTVSYRELWSDVVAVAGAWSQASDMPVKPGDFVATVGFAKASGRARCFSARHTTCVAFRCRCSGPA